MSGTKAEGAQRYLPAERDLRDLAALAEAAVGCQGCELHRAADRTVFGEGGRQRGDHARPWLRAALEAVRPRSVVLRMTDERRHDAYAAFVDDLRVAEQFCAHPPHTRRSGATT